MDLDLTQDQDLLRTTTRQFLEATGTLSSVRDQSGFSRQWWAQGAELGWTAMLVPEEMGGGSVSGHGLQDLAILAEELGRSVATGPLIPTNVVLAGLTAAVPCGQPGLRNEIEALVDGTRIATWAVCEPGAQWVPLNPVTRATAVGGGSFTLSGVKDRVECAAEADVILVTAMTDDGLVQLLVPAGTAGVRIEPVWSLDLSRSFATVTFDEVQVSPDAVVGTPLTAPGFVERQTQVAIALQCADTCGGLVRVFDMTRQWARDRYTFGRPLDSYQALKHRFADMKTGLEACQATATGAAEAVQVQAPDAAELVSVAKSYLAPEALRIVQDCIQIHGGIGLTWEHDLHLFLRRMLVNRGLYGTPEDHRRRLADIISL